MKPLRAVAGSIAMMILWVSGGRAERVGLTQTWVDTSRPIAYRIEGGSNEFHATGEICSLMKSFVVEGAGVTVKFIPRSTRRGRYEYLRKVDGGDVVEQGTYEVQYDGPWAIGIVATGPSAGEEMGIYRLKQVRGACQD